MAYVALYRKYRSQTFSELMGQEAVTTTLQNSLKSGRFAHAYLFHGARGCGKTSTARLLARALNCQSQDRPAAEPCGKCALCVSIREGTCLDVVEIDAASETSIDDVREKIIENVQYAPAEARYKVYIIDEVHDLSAKAFDALLKTLEEPPAHVVFILATTEWHKVPITIRSRCQPFAFRRGTVQDLAASIQRVIDSEGYQAEAEAVQAIARAAEGSWRDALSLLEQVLAYSEGNITAQTVYRAVGTVGLDTLMRVADTVADGRWDEVLRVAGELIDTGADARQLITALHGHLRDLMLIAAGARKAAEQELGAERVSILAPQAQRFSPERLLNMMTLLSGAERDIRFTNHSRWLLESVLLKLASGHAASAAPAGAADVAATHTRSLPEPPAVVPRPPVHAVRSDTVPPVPVEEAAETPAEPASPADDTVSGASETSGRYAEALTTEALTRAWPRILDQFKRKSPNGYGFLLKATPIGLENNVIVLGFADTFARDRIQNKGRELVERNINETLHTDGLKIRCMLTSAEAAPPTARADEPGNEASQQALLDAPQAEAKRAAARIADFDAATAVTGAPAAQTQEVSKPTVSLLDDVLEVFGGEVVGTEETA